MKRLTFCLILSFMYAFQAYSQCVELDNNENVEPDIQFLHAGQEGSKIGKTINGTTISNFINNSYVGNVKRIVKQSNCSLGKYDFFLGSETNGGYLELTLSDDLQKTYESIDVYANQYEKKNSSTGTVTKYPAELSVNGSDPYPITHEPSTAGGYNTLVNSKNYGLYRYTLADPEVPLTTVRLESTGRIVLKQLNFNIKQGTQSISNLEADKDTVEEYFDLEGRKANPDNLRPGIYIVKKGQTVTKVIIRN